MSEDEKIIGMYYVQTGITVSKIEDIDKKCLEHIKKDLNESITETETEAIEFDNWNISDTFIDIKSRKVNLLRNRNFVITGKSGEGKTTFAIDFMIDLLQSNEKSFLIYNSMDDYEPIVRSKLLSRLLRKRIDKYNKTDIAKLEGGQEALDFIDNRISVLNNTKKIFEELITKPTGIYKDEYISLLTFFYKVKCKGYEKCIFYIDFIQHGRFIKESTSYREHLNARITNLKEAAKEVAKFGIDVIVILISQVSRSWDKTSGMIEATAESSEITTLAEAGISIKKKGNLQSGNYKTEINIEKNKCGDELSFTLIYDKDKTTYLPLYSSEIPQPSEVSKIEPNKKKEIEVNKTVSKIDTNTHNEVEHTNVLISKFDEHKKVNEVKPNGNSTLKGLSPNRTTKLFIKKLYHNFNNTDYASLHCSIAVFYSLRNLLFEGVSVDFLVIEAMEHYYKFNITNVRAYLKTFKGKTLRLYASNELHNLCDNHFYENTDELGKVLFVSEATYENEDDKKERLKNYKALISKRSEKNDFENKNSLNSITINVSKTLFDKTVSYVSHPKNFTHLIVRKMKKLNKNVKNSTMSESILFYLLLMFKENGTTKIKITKNDFSTYFFPSCKPPNNNSSTKIKNKIILFLNCYKAIYEEQKANKSKENLWLVPVSEPLYCKKEKVFIITVNDIRRIDANTKISV